MPPEILKSEKLEVLQGLERSESERERGVNVRAEEAAQIFDERIPVQEKVTILLKCYASFSATDVILDPL